MERVLFDNLWGKGPEERDRAMWNNLEVFGLFLEEISERIGATEHERRKEIFRAEEFKLDLARRILYGSPDHTTLLPDEQIRRNIASLRLAQRNLSSAAREGTRVTTVLPFFKGTAFLSKNEVDVIANTTSAYPRFSEPVGAPEGWFRMALYLQKKLPCLFSAERLKKIFPGETF